ncbi:MAG: type II toxin-antitoxin system PemK/MazF family toxin [Candidatus Nitrosotenuis sp.]
MTRSGISFEQGDILLIAFPFNDLTKVKQRPVLVLSNKNHNYSSNDFICCGITSNLDNKKYSIILDKSDMRQGGIPKILRIKFNKIFTLEKSLVIKRIGRINAKKLKRVQKALMELLM